VLISNLASVRSLLDRNRAWAAYAIGDLAPGYVEHCEWHAPSSGAPALLLLYRGYDPPILFAMGHAGDLGALFREITAPQISLHVRPDAVAAMENVYVPTETRRLQRMVLRARAFHDAGHQDVRRLSEQDLESIAALYQDGHRRGEGPTFFHAAMLRQGTFHGLWEGTDLVSIAGTHLYSPKLGVCAIGNVYTRADRRGRGLAARVTSAVVARALGDGVPTIVLNVGCDNAAAQRIYERLGFERHCEFLEGEATRVMESAGPAR
jgi:ribosomal protein S18 acetylase RimI-like enzyme